MPLVSGEAKVLHYWVEPSCDRLYALRGQSVALTVKSNSSSPRVQIYDPSNALIYNQVWGVNQTRNIPISASAAYGTYTVKATANSDTATTWLTVLKIDGWIAVTQFPYNVSFQNFQYSFASDFSLTVANSGDSLKIDFSFLRDLKTEFGLDLDPMQNGMNFLLRFTKLNVKVDVDFAFIHSGAKIIINGTIPQARTLGIDVSATALKRYLNDLRSGNIVFDWSDMKDVVQYSNGRLSVTVPQSFHLDPYIFSDGFETGDFAAWSGTGVYEGAITVESDHPHHGTYSAKAVLNALETGAAAYSYYLISPSVTELYMREYVYPTQIPNANNNDCRMGPHIGVIGSYVDTIANVVRNFASNKWGIRAYVSGAYAWYMAAGTSTFDINTWYCLELYLKIDNATGIVRLWVDGTLLVEQTGLDTDNYGNIGSFLCGQRRAPVDYNVDSIQYYDCVVVDSSYIGLESTAYTVSLTQAWAMSQSVAAASVFHAPLTQGISEAQSISATSAFHVPLTQVFSESQSVSVTSAFHSALSQAFTVPESATVQSVFNIPVSEAFSTSCDVSSGTLFIVGLSQSISSTMDSTVQTEFHVALSKVFTFLKNVSIIFTSGTPASGSLAALAFIMAISALAIVLSQKWRN